MLKHILKENGEERVKLLDYYLNLAAMSEVQGLVFSDLEKVSSLLEESDSSYTFKISYLINDANKLDNLEELKVKLSDNFISLYPTAVMNSSLVGDTMNIEIVMDKSIELTSIDLELEFDSAILVSDVLLFPYIHDLVNKDEKRYQDIGVLSLQCKMEKFNDNVTFNFGNDPEDQKF